MKHKVLFLLVIVCLLSFTSNAQRGVRIAYIDTEYILQNVPEYQDANLQLDKKVQKWKTEIEKRLNIIEQKKKELNSEKVLLTKELYDERFEDITYEEAEILDYQQKRFGPNGDLMIQKKQLIQPVQDQIFAAVQEIAANKKYDFVFDKSADVVMLYSANRFDISEQILRSITRTSKRKQTKTKAERKAAEKEDVVPEINEELDARTKALADKKDARAKGIDERRKKQQELREAKKREADERKAKILEDRKKARDAKINARNKTTDSTTVKNKTVTDSTTAAKAKTAKTDVVKSANDKKKTAAELIKERNQQKIKDREARKKALEDRRKKILEDRKEAIRKKDSIRNSKKNNENN